MHLIIHQQTRHAHIRRVCCASYRSYLLPSYTSQLNCTQPSSKKPQYNPHETEYVLGHVRGISESIAKGGKKVIKTRKIKCIPIIPKVCKTYTHFPIDYIYKLFSKLSNITYTMFLITTNYIIK